MPIIVCPECAEPMPQSQLVCSHCGCSPTKTFWVRLGKSALAVGGTAILVPLTFALLALMAFAVWLLAKAYF